MKRYNSLYPKIYDTDNIVLAHKNARKGKLHYREVKIVDKNTEYYLQKIHQMLKFKSFKNSPYDIFIKTDSGKEREIYKLPYFPDRIIQHAIMQIVEPIWKKSLINDTYSSIKDRGIHKGVKRVKHTLTDTENTKYCLKLDIKKYYPSIDHDILKQIVRRKIKDSDLLWLLDEIIESAPGIPIGNYLSQYFANLYLSGFDHWVKEKLKVKYYFRYCDDMILLSSNKEMLHYYLKEINNYILALKLKLKSNYKIIPTKTGIDFLGYVFYPQHTLVRRKIRDNCIQKLKEGDIGKLCNSLTSYYGWFKHCNSYNLRKKLFDNKIISNINLYCINNNLTNPIRRVFS